MKCKNEKIFRQIKEILHQIKENIMKLDPFSSYLAFNSSQNLILFALLYLYIWFKNTYVHTYTNSAFIHSTFELKFIQLEIKTFGLGSRTRDVCS